MMLNSRLFVSGLIASLALVLAIGCDKPATAGGSTSVIRGAPINKLTPVEPAPSAQAPNTKPSKLAAAPEPAGAQPGPSPDAARKPADGSQTPVAVPYAGSSKDASAPAGSPPKSAIEGNVAAKPDRASLLRAKRLPMDDKTPVGTPDKDKPDYLRVNFDDLASYDYDPFEALPPELDGGTHRVVEEEGVGPQPQPAAPVKNAQIPERIMVLHKKKIIVQGFMVPIEFKRDSVRSFLLVRNQMMCCFGAMIGMNEWLMVQMDGEKRTSYVQDVPTTVYGELEVGEDIQNGMVMSLYRLRGFEVQFKGGR